MTDVPEGSIVRTITRLDELCKDIRNAARVIGNPSLYRKLEAVIIIAFYSTLSLAQTYTLMWTCRIQRLICTHILFFIKTFLLYIWIITQASECIKRDIVFAASMYVVWGKDSWMRVIIIANRWSWWLVWLLKIFIFVTSFKRSTYF